MGDGIIEGNRHRRLLNPMAFAHPNPRVREEVQLWAYQLLRGCFYVLDTETTGLGTQAEIVQLALIDCSGETVINTLVKPTRPCPAEVTRIHGITNEMLADAPTMADLYIPLSAKLAASTLIAYNMEFDWRMLQQSLAVYGLPLPVGVKRQCAMQAYARYYGQRSPRSGGYAWQSLSSACRQQNIRLEYEHSALGDARATLALLRQMARP
jgi:DNA polymerase-3 subunit epsilon